MPVRKVMKKKKFNAKRKLILSKRRSETSKKRQKQ